MPEAARATRAGDRFFELSRDLLAVLRPDGSFVRLNAAWEEALDIPRGELMASDLVGLVHPDDVDLAGRVLASAGTPAGEGVRVDLRFRTAGGSVRWIQWSSVYDEREGLFYAAGRDVTDAREARDRLFESEERYRELFESHPVPMAVWDPATMEIIDANDAALRQYGYTLEDLRGMTIDRLVDRADWPRLLSRLTQLGAGLAGSEVFTHRRKDGTPIEVEVTGHAVEYAGRFARVVMALPIGNSGTSRLDRPEAAQPR
ncbi:MAG TPA: PAS domain S-box protein [Candidatus Limnocylindrales bacterium]|nr:PAS domain S-box protein [Candidatus Limnocylindrales bacterium]